MIVLSSRGSSDHESKLISHCEHRPGGLTYQILRNSSGVATLALLVQQPGQTILGALNACQVPHAPTTITRKSLQIVIGTTRLSMTVKDLSSRSLEIPAVVTPCTTISRFRQLNQMYRRNSIFTDHR